MLNALTKVEVQHEKEVLQLLQLLDLEQPTIVAGEFNSLSTFIAPSTLTEHGLVDSFSSYFDTPDLQHTWKWPIHQPRIRLRIDYIFHSGQWATSSCKIFPNQASDHSLAVCSLQKDIAAHQIP